MGKNTATKTSPIAIKAPPTSVMVFSAAFLTPMPAFKFRSMFSTTTMASSTTIPMANTKPNSVKLFNEKPNACITAKVPTRETGMARIGTIAALHV